MYLILRTFSAIRLCTVYGAKAVLASGAVVPPRNVYRRLQNLVDPKQTVVTAS